MFALDCSVIASIESLFLRKKHFFSGSKFPDPDKIAIVGTLKCWNRKKRERESYRKHNKSVIKAFFSQHCLSRFINKMMHASRARLLIARRKSGKAQSRRFSFRIGANSEVHRGKLLFPIYLVLRITLKVPRGHFSGKSRSISARYISISVNARITMKKVGDIARFSRKERRVARHVPDRVQGFFPSRYQKTIFEPRFT